MSKMTNRHVFLSFDVGEKRIGIAQADSEVRIASPLTTLNVDGMEQQRIRQIVAEHEPSVLVVGLPRNQSGETTMQSKVSQQFAAAIENFGVDVVLQDESLTSVLAEQYLKKHRKNYTKADIDSHAAAIILGDYLEQVYGH